VLAQVLTPVRRSARKAMAPPRSGLALGDVQSKLEATHFCYEGNQALTPAAKGEPARSKKP
jgi:hypothetical protein